MTSRTDPRGKNTNYGYDAAGNMVSQSDPLGKIWQYTYDQNNNLLSVVTPDSRTTQYQYDALNRRTRTIYSNSTNITYTYDANSNLTMMVDNVGATMYQYDAANRLTQLTDPFGNIVSYTYDRAGNRTSVKYPGNRTANFAYDTAERMSTATDWGNRTATYTYNLSDQVTRLVHGNASTADYTYDTAGRLTSLINKRPNGTVISSHTHTLDQHGNITQADEVLPLQPTLTPRTKRWSVDASNRVLSDAVSSDSFEHDTAGRMIRQVMNGVTTNFAYNDLDLLTTLTSPARTESYRYNGHGHRIERTVNGVASRYLVEPNGTMPNMLAELSNTNNPQRFYVHGANGLLSQIDAAGNYHAYHFAPIGNTTALTDAAGNVSDTYAYLPYGETFAGAGNATTNPFKFVGRFGVMDEGNGLQYMRARYYKPDAGRFMSLDAIAGNSDEPQSLNRIAYTHGNPISGNDPSGLCNPQFASCPTQVNNCYLANITCDEISDLSSRVDQRNFFWNADPFQKHSVVSESYKISKTSIVVSNKPVVQTVKIDTLTVKVKSKPSVNVPSKKTVVITTVKNTPQLTQHYSGVRIGISLVHPFVEAGIEY